MYARITRDYIAQGDWKAATGTTFGSPSTAVGEVYKVRLLDDDGEVYYHAEADDEALEGLYDWAAHDVGTTLLQTRNADGTWKDVIA